MKFLRKILDIPKPWVEGRGKLRRFYPLYEALDTFFYTPATVTKGFVHLRDHLDMKRLMTTVVVALIPCMLFGMFNTGLQLNLAIEQMGIEQATGWRAQLLTFAGLGFNPQSYIDNFLHGALYFIPIYIVTNVVGGLWEVLFATVRKHEINEGFFVTGAIFPLILPASIPLWQVAIGISFGVIFGKEIFGGTGRNFLNPALVARTFLFFAYPRQISGNSVWVPLDGFSGATSLGEITESGISSLSTTWLDSFIGLTPGCIGETSVIACLIGAIILIYTGVGSWRIMLSVLIGMFFVALFFNMIGSETNHMFALTPMGHLVLGGFIFGTVFMATDPVSGSLTTTGQYFYGALIGSMVVFIRVVNPAFPEGMMLAILFGNMVAPVIDFFVVEANIKRRKLTQ